METEGIDARCDVCGEIASPVFDNPGEEKLVYCTDCYLRRMGYDPDAVGQRFAEIARVAMADLINERTVDGVAGGTG